MKLSELEQQVKSGATLTHLSVTGEKRVKTGLSSGSMVLNAALSGLPNVGYAWGRIVEIYGPESSGKSTLAFHAVHEAQKLGMPCMYIDAEHACDPDYMAAIGINHDQMTFCQPDYGEQALETAIESVQAGYRLIVVDSVAALTPLAELQGDMDSEHVGRQARMMGKGLRKISAMAGKAGCTIIFINQIRDKIGVMFGNPETTPGGKALRFYASYRVEIRSPRGGKIEEKSIEKETVETGTKSNITVVKNKMYPPFRKAHITLVYGKGIDKLVDVVDYLESAKLMEVDGKGTAKIRLLGKVYTKKTLVEALRAGGADLRKEILKLLRTAVKGE